jgi:microcystin-dependent protein
MTQVVRPPDVYQTLNKTDERLGSLERTDNVPVGTLLMYGGSEAPPGYLLCDGSAHSRTEFSNLFGVLGTRFGVGDGSTTFNVPNLANKFPLGLAPGVSPGSTIGQTGGEQNHILATAELPTHTHTASQPAHTHTDAGHNHASFNAGSNAAFMELNGTLNTAAGANQYGVTHQSFVTQTGYASLGTATPAITVNNAGGGESHNNMPPYITINFIICCGIRIA